MPSSWQPCFWRWPQVPPRSAVSQTFRVDRSGGPGSPGLGSDRPRCRADRGGDGNGVRRGLQARAPERLAEPRRRTVAGGLARVRGDRRSRFFATATSTMSASGVVGSCWRPAVLTTSPLVGRPASRTSSPRSAGCNGAIPSTPRASTEWVGRWGRSASSAWPHVTRIARM